MFEIYEGALNVPEIYAKWYEKSATQNCGAMLTFCGIVRDDDEVQALSFDIDEALLKKWFETWKQKLNTQGVSVFFAHSKGEVKVGQSSYLAGILSKQRKLGLKLINDFVEDFKAKAPIWKYDVKNGLKIYAKERSTKLEGAGILA
ncbi:molybdenum cofactor biosynthesis protein MoaE [Campylobacter sp. MIT 99-7217]|uniref:molybdopterin synthase catalytic subunit n=1 Tax=Campylobacter sp. MIT 99-7217 TaxID=535091 RepID=UPI00115870FD|nr:molybdenum cofactor biosynthesis protein MoaE [Campylobacter sp. MIT 99-7217]TQR30347.1 molybdenum cofactor biosynthesis protein MoaE [Campylobacter sp. MIT 99-7217]